GGRFTLYVPVGEARALPMAEAIAARQPLDPSVLSPLLAPLADLRSALSGRFDLRFLGFRLELAFLHAESGEHCLIPGDLNDPEGRRVGACFRCGPGGQGQALCREGDQWPGLISGSPAELEQLGGALRP
ncbi:MAG: hypothetical protein VX498_01365, partial [Myxococcota bacterium]|nr:hypothetical protein [Myxococcota bacterium]